MATVIEIIFNLKKFLKNLKIDPILNIYPRLCHTYKKSPWSQTEIA